MSINRIERHGCYSGSASASAASPSGVTGFEGLVACAGAETEAFFTLGVAGAGFEQVVQTVAFCAGGEAAVPLRGTARPATRYFLIFSNRFGPMPLTDSKSSTVLNAPYDFRI